MKAQLAISRYERVQPNYTLQPVTHSLLTVHQFTVSSQDECYCCKLTVTHKMQEHATGYATPAGVLLAERTVRYRDRVTSREYMLNG